MHLTIIGASQGVGYEATLQALQKGYRVTALARQLDTLPNDQNLIKLEGSATEAHTVSQAIAHSDALLICIGTKQKKGITLFSSMAKTVIEAAEKMNYDKPILVISGFGVGKSYPYANLFIKLVIRFFLKDQYTDKKLMEDLFESSRLAWEMVQPGILSDGPLTSDYHIYPSLTKGMTVGKIARRAIADFMLKEAGNPKYLHKKVVLSH